MANVRGAPKLAGKPPLKAEFDFRDGYQGGELVGLGVGRQVADYDYAADLWKVNGQPLDLPLGTGGSPAPTAALVVTFMTPLGNYPLAVLPMVSPGKDYLDLRAPHYAPGYIPSKTLEQLIADGEALRAFRPLLEATQARATLAATDAEKAAAEARGAVEAYNGTALFLVGRTELGPIVTAINADRLKRDTVPIKIMSKPRQLRVIRVQMGAE